MSLDQLRALILAAETVVTAQADLAVLHAAFDSVSITLVAFLGLLRAAHIADAVLFDIPSTKRQRRSSSPAPRTYGLPTSTTSRH